MNRRKKRERSYEPSPLPKRPRRWPPGTNPVEAHEAGSKGEEGLTTTKRSSSSLVMVTGLPSDCTVLELKSRLEMYGPISRISIGVNGSGFVTFRSDHSADAAISAALDPAFGITVRSKKVLVCRASDPVAQWRIGVEVSPPSKLLRAEMPLSRHGRSNKKLTAGTTSTITGPDLAFGRREIVAYDDLL